MKEAIVILLMVIGFIGSLISIILSYDGWSMKPAFLATLSGALMGTSSYILVTSFGRGGIGWAMVAIGFTVFILLFIMSGYDDVDD